MTIHTRRIGAANWLAWTLRDDGTPRGLFGYGSDPIEAINELAEKLACKGELPAQLRIRIT